MKIKKNELKDVIKGLRKMRFTNYSDSLLFLPIDTDDLDVQDDNDLILLTERDNSGYANLTKPGLLVKVINDSCVTVEFAYATLDYQYRISFQQHFMLDSFLKEYDFSSENEDAIKILFGKDAYLIKPELVLANFGEVA